MKVKDVMSSDPHYLGSDATCQEAAKLMEECDCGMVPISEGDRLIGIVTDRDIVIRGIARNLGPDARASECMTSKVLYCFQDDDVSEVAQNMDQQNVQRLVVLDDPQQKRLCGIVSMSDIAEACSGDAELSQAVSEASRHYHESQLH